MRIGRGLFVDGVFPSHSGLLLPFKVCCENFTSHDWHWAAAQIHALVGNFRAVEGVPDGGTMLAECLEEYTTSRGKLLIVDDVLTTGNSMESQRDGRKAIGCVVFARGPLPSWVQALWTWTGKPTDISSTPKSWDKALAFSSKREDEFDA